MAQFNSGIGVLHGLVVRDPQSATLTATIEGGRISLRLSTGLITEFRVASVAKAFTASKDTFVVITSAGAFGYTEVANGAAKPSKSTIETTHGVGAQIIAKVVTDGSRVTDGGVTDLRNFRTDAADIRSEGQHFSFAASSVGAQYMKAPCRIRLLEWQGSLYVAAAATDAGTVTLAVGRNDKYTDMTNGVASFAASSAIGTRASALPSDNYVVNPGQTIRATTAKTTAGGAGVGQFLYQILPINREQAE